MTAIPTRLWRGAPWPLRLYFCLRSLTCPLHRVAEHVSPRGTVVDFGCGYGLLAAWLAATGPDREVVALDVAADKVQAGARVFRDLPVRWGDARDPLPPCHAVVAVDVLYLMPAAEQRRFLARAARALRPGGVLLLKTMDVRPRWKVAWDRLQDGLVLGLFGLHPRQGLCRRSPDALEADLRASGFRVDRVPLGRGYLHPHLLLVARLVEPAADAGVPGGEPAEGP